MTDPDPDITATRHALHGVAEHLLAGDLWRRTERIGLRQTPGGFGQPEVTLDDGSRHRLRIDGAALVVLDDRGERWHPLATIADAAAFAGVEVGAPSGAYDPETDVDPAAALAVDPGAAARLAGWFDLVGRALEEMRRRHRDLAPPLAQLWPEHFDLAFSMAEVNFGGSPGDGGHEEPYLYVGPWDLVPGDHWNEPFGASASWTEVSDEAAALSFLEAGFAAAQAGG